MKQIIFVITLAFALFIVDGCGSSKKSTTSTTDTTHTMSTDSTQHK